MTSTARTLYTVIIDQPSLEQDFFLYLWEPGRKVSIEFMDPRYKSQK